MTYQILIRNEYWYNAEINQVCFIEFDKKECVISASPYLMFLMGRTLSDVEQVFAKRGWQWTRLS